MKCGLGSVFITRYDFCSTIGTCCTCTEAVYTTVVVVLRSAVLFFLSRRHTLLADCTPCTTSQATEAARDTRDSHLKLLRSSRVLAVHFRPSLQPWIRNNQTSSCCENAVQYQLSPVIKLPLTKQSLKMRTNHPSSREWMKVESLS